MAFADSKHGVVVGGNYLKPEQADSNIAVTNDGGQTWKRPTGKAPRGYRSSVAYFSLSDSNRLIAVGPDGTDVSSDAGVNWKPASDTGFHAVDFTPNGKVGWASGSE